MGGTLAFLDESGDPSYDLAAGASSLFVVALVVFTDAAEAARCSERILRLRRELGKSERYEFHFRDNAHPDRIAFLDAVRRFDFTYHAAAFEKDRIRPAEHSLLISGCTRVCEAAQLQRALLVIDGQPGRRRNRQLITAVRNSVVAACGRSAVDGVQVQDSARTPLLQVADYIAGVVNREALGRPGGSEYREILKPRGCTYWRGQA